MTQLSTKTTALVTGATGYVAGWIIKKLLEEGHTVHAAVRDPGNQRKLQHLDQIAANSPGEIRYFKADLLKDGSYAEAMQGCEVVFHTASPFVTDVKDPVKELIEPAQLGTRNVLEEANRVESVKRVVLTSSCAAIYGDNIDLSETPNGVFTEEIWNTSSSVEHQPYSYSKTLAEREAWKIAEAQSRWDLVVMNPCLVMGPGLSKDITSESFNILRQSGDGTLRFGGAALGIGVIDVRDLAEAHYRAAFTPGANGRNIIAAHDTDLAEINKILHARYGAQFPIPTRTLPKPLLWLFGPMTNKLLTRKSVTRNIGLPWRSDGSKARRELGLTYRPLEETIHEMFQFMIDQGQLKPRA